jgi:2-oxoglutarate/2-oxoacid ferredoxin oxidoreductase subunit beta
MGSANDDVLAGHGITERAGGLGTLTRKDFVSDQEVRWCPGCGDYAILAAIQSVMPELGVPREKIVFVSGIGCASRFPYYMNTYGLHGIHGRAPALATGLATTRPDLSVWVVMGDGDALSIGGNHLIHAWRRNVNIKLLMFNNQIYGLTKGQYSPTSEQGKITKSTPFGSLERPFNPVSVALGAEGTFVARTMDVERKHLPQVLRRVAAHRGSAFVEIYQNCNIFNDGAFLALASKEGGSKNRIYLEHGKPVRFGTAGEKGVRMDKDGRMEIVDVAEVGAENLVVHDEHRDDPSLAFALSRIADGPTMPTPFGIFREVQRPVYGEIMENQLRAAAEQQGPGDLERLLFKGDTWTVG